MEIKTLLAEVKWGEFDYETDIFSFLYGFGSGAIGVFPSNSMFSYCKTNTSSIYPTAETMAIKFGNLDVLNALKDL
jgi:hypothetical protein